MQTPNDLTSSTVNLLPKEPNESTDSNIIFNKTSQSRVKLKLIIAFCFVLIVIALAASAILIISKLKPESSSGFHLMNISTTSYPSTLSDLPSSATSSLPPGPAAPELCNTPECSLIAEQMLGFMDPDANPCHNFYDYACGGYKNTSQASGRKEKSIIEHVYREILLKIKVHLEQTENLDELDGELQDSRAIQKARRYYKACMKEDFNGGDHLRKLTSHVGSWPLHSSDISNDWNSKNWNFEEALSKALELSDPLLDVQLKRNEKNISEYIIYVDQAGLLFPSHHYTASESLLSESHETYIQHFKDTCQHLGAKADVLDELAENVWQFEKSLGEAFEPRDRTVDPNKLYNLMTVEEFQKILSVNNGKHVINIQTLLSKQMKRSVSLTDTIVVQVPDYFRKMALLVNNTDTETLSSYLVWSMVRKLSPRAGGPFLETYNRLLKRLENKTEDTTYKHWERCVADTNAVMRFATGALYVQKYFSEEDRQIVLNVMEFLTKEFSAAVAKTTWMTDSVKKAAIDKINNLKINIGFPDFILNKTKLDSYYANFNVTDDPLLNSINYGNFKFDKLLEKFDSEPSEENWDNWAIKPTDVNAYYVKIVNQIVIPAGILQPPFYSKHNPTSLLFGSLGTMLGHELIHGFDPAGSRYGPKGELLNWWDVASREQFNLRSQCFVNEYNNFSTNGQNINGSRTLNENVADNGGMDMSWSAYRTWKKLKNSNDIGDLQETKIAMIDSLLPSLNLTTTQQFFVSFAQFFCSSYNTKDLEKLFSSDGHAINEYRVLGVLRNMEEFSEAFSCDNNTPMYPEQRCRLW